MAESDATRAPVESRSGRWIAAAFVALAVSVAGVWGGRAIILRQRVRGCEDLGARVDTVWTAEARELVHDGIRRSGAVDADDVAERASARIDEFAARWNDVRTTACVDAEVELTLEHAYYAQVTWCLDDALLGLEALLGEAARPSRATAYRSIDAAAELSSPTTCRRPDATARLPRLPEGSERSHLREVRAAVQLAGLRRDSSDEGLALAIAALEDAEEIGWAPLTSVAARQVCARQGERGALELARAACERAYADASAQGLHDLAADAAIELVRLVGVGLGRTDDGRTWAGHAEVAITELAEPDVRRTVRWLSARGDVARHAGAPTQARADHDRALAIAERELGTDEPVILELLDGISLDEDRLGHAAGAVATRERAVLLAEAIYGVGHPRMVRPLTELARARHLLGDAAGAQRDATRAVLVLVRAWTVDGEAISASP